MVARAFVASCALIAFAGSALAQDAVIIVDVTNRTSPTHARQVARNDDQYAAIIAELHIAKTDALLLYTDFASRAGNDLKIFLNNITGFADGVIRNLNAGPPFNDVNECWTKFEYRVKKIEHDARKAAVYSGDCHHKFLLGHMIVFRMHLNKSEDYLKRCDKVTRNCNQKRPCELTPRVRRWQRLALSEIHRVQDDMPFTRRSYRDLVSHARRKLNHLKKQAISKSCAAIEDYKYCINRG